MRRRFLAPYAVLLCLIVSLTACATTAPVVKIGLVAPFEGRYRAIGYEAIYAARLAIREINARGGVNGYRLELVALDDRGEPDRAIVAARQLVIDPQVIAALGHYWPASTDAAIETYCQSGVPLIAVESAAALPSGCVQPLDVFVVGHAPRGQWADDLITFVSSAPDPNEVAAARDFIAAYNTIPIDGTRAGPIALQTYDIMRVLFEALGRVKTLDRVGVAAALAGGQFDSLSGTYAFDRTGNLIGAPTYVFEYDRAGAAHPVEPR